MILLITKFTQVWPILLFLPFVVSVFIRINTHYKNIAQELRSDIDVHDIPVVIVIWLLCQYLALRLRLINRFITHKCWLTMM